MSSARLLTLLALTVLCVGCEYRQDDDVEANKDLVRRFVEISNTADWDRLSEVVTQDFQRHSTATAGPPVRSLDEFVALQESFLATFPDQRVRVDKLIAEDDIVAVRAAYLGTQTGPMGGLPATGNAVDAPFIAFFRVDSGKIAELWVEWDNIAIMAQLGLWPPGPQQDAGVMLKQQAEEFLRGVYTGDLSVIDRMAAPDIVISYPIFAEIFNTPALRGREAVREFSTGFSKRWVDADFTVLHAVADRDEVVLIWEFEARSTAPANPGDAESPRKAWGGVTLYRFNEAGQITLELGEESTPGPVARLPGVFGAE